MVDIRMICIYYSVGYFCSLNYELRKIITIHCHSIYEFTISMPFENNCFPSLYVSIFNTEFSMLVGERNFNSDINHCD